MAKLSVKGQALIAHLRDGASTVCRCWRVVRRDGKVLGFTDHDGDLEFDGTAFSAATGFTAAAVEQTTGLAVNNTEAVGALRAGAITEEDISAGRYDGAVVTCWVVNWADPEQRMVQFNGSLGEVTRCGEAFSAELRGATEALNQPQGRVYQSMCSAVLCDGDCRFDPEMLGYSMEAPVLSVDGGVKLIVADGGQEEGWFSRGRLEVLDGAARGLIAIIKRDCRLGASREIELWQEIRPTLDVGDSVRLVAGCDKRAATCRDKFNNFDNFRGFPHIPGEDWLTAYPKQGDDNDGGSLNG
ncbi:DUF2163 domain-containing protein [Tropicimonas isoalkanivorans]|uniref:Bacteriophage phiJL001 Gp84 C-terminal domain-containing protein n=1 Tax=Tropicimonas isoalkanivorans TaxID=441112 RepID=A0A1I1EEP2_9RHOB|nr:DUF2163 domain-containing protein [Tropicimonas isoalkanivorans]SFB83393.1 phage conserved hypothetical protein BR0599 [Tropicimonas isoalkanivorans]